MKELKGVLVVEDSLMDVYLAEKILEVGKISSNILSAGNGKEGLEKIELFYKEHKQLPELILVDLQMPTMDGFEFIKRLKNLSYYDEAKTKIVMLTASIDDINDVRKMNGLGVRNFFLKPLNKNELIKLLLAQYAGSDLNGNKK